MRVAAVALALASCADPAATEPAPGLQTCCDAFSCWEQSTPCGGSGGAGVCQWQACDPLGGFPQAVCVSACGYQAGCQCDYVYQDGYCPSAHCG